MQNPSSPLSDSAAPIATSEVATPSGSEEAQGYVARFAPPPLPVPAPEVPLVAAVPPRVPAPAPVSVEIIPPKPTPGAPPAAPEPPAVSGSEERTSGDLMRYAENVIYGTGPLPEDCWSPPLLPAPTSDRLRFTEVVELGQVHAWRAALTGRCAWSPRRMLPIAAVVVAVAVGFTLALAGSTSPDATELPKAAGEAPGEPTASPPPAPARTSGVTAKVGAKPARKTSGAISRHKIAKRKPVPRKRKRSPRRHGR